jgi:type I restriction enzyme R subunit
LAAANLIEGRLFSEMLTDALRRYDNRAIQAAQVIEELIAIAKQMREANARGEDLGLTEEELAFYDALETNDSAVQVLGDEKLCLIARELVEAVRRNTSIDWTMRENVRAQIRVMVKRILRKYGYPPDLQAKATETVLRQAELLSWDSHSLEARFTHRGTTLLCYLGFVIRRVPNCGLVPPSSL